MRNPRPRAPSTKLINTHANPDHCNGNELVAEAEIIASKAAAEEMAAQSPAQHAALMRQAPDMGETGRFLLEAFSAFDFEGIKQTLPTMTFEGEYRTRVGDKAIGSEAVRALPHLRRHPGSTCRRTGSSSPAHILFIESHPILWAGPGRQLDRGLRLYPGVAPRHGRPGPRSAYGQARRPGCA